MFVPFSFHCLVALCSAIVEANVGTPSSSRARVCVEVATEAQAQGVDPLLAVSVAWRESAFIRSARSSAGAVGPMQVLPRFWCKSKPCDHIEAGVRALRYYTERHGVNDGLCAYFSGKPCGSASRHYMQAVLETFEAFKEQHFQACEGC